LVDETEAIRVYGVPYAISILKDRSLGVLLVIKGIPTETEY
jgi:hypothetical protein